MSDVPSLIRKIGDFFEGTMEVGIDYRFTVDIQKTDITGFYISDNASFKKKYEQEKISALLKPSSD